MYCILTFTIIIVLHEHLAILFSEPIKPDLGAEKGNQDANRSNL